MEDEMGIISYSFYTQATKQCLWHYDCHADAYGLRILLVRVDSLNNKGENCEIIEFAWLEITMLKQFQYSEPLRNLTVLKCKFVDFCSTETAEGTNTMGNGKGLEDTSQTHEVTCCSRAFGVMCFRKNVIIHVLEAREFVLYAAFTLTFRWSGRSLHDAVGCQ